MVHTVLFISAKRGEMDVFDAAEDVHVDIVVDLFEVRDQPFDLLAFGIACTVIEKLDIGREMAGAL